METIILAITCWLYIGTPILSIDHVAYAYTTMFTCNYKVCWLDVYVRAVKNSSSTASFTMINACEIHNENLANFNVASLANLKSSHRKPANDIHIMVRSS